jgi:phosphoribosylformylglycinamidine cyclo-ligase
VALVGGETAEHPQLLAPNEYDVAGAATGVVEHTDLLGPDRVQPGDVVLGLRSSGLHSNGYSLVRRAIERAGWNLERQVPDFGRTLGEELLEPTTVYAAHLLGLIRADGVDVHALSHVTGGGLVANLARVLPSHLHARLDRSTWQPHAVFDVIGRLGDVPSADLERTFNMGVGFAVLLPASQADLALRLLADDGIDGWVMGEVEQIEEAHIEEGHEVVAGTKGWHGGSVQLVGSFAHADG